MAGIGERPPTTTSSDAAAESSGALLPGGGDYEEALEEDVVVEEEPFERELYAGGIPWDERAESTLGRSYGTDPNKFTIDPFRGPQMLPYDHPQNRRDNSYAPLYDSYFGRRYLNSLSTYELAALEQQMYAAGYNLVEEGTGFRSSNLITAFESLIVESNNNRNEWDTQLTENIRLWQESEEERAADAVGPWIAPDRLKPDYAYLAQTVKTAVRGRLGREPTASEMKILTSNLGGHYKDQYSQEEVVRSKSDWEKRGRAALTGENVEDAAVITDISPLDRFTEHFEERYSGELAHRDRTDQVRGNQGNLFRSLDMASRMVG